MLLRTTPEIFADHYGLPTPPHWEKFVDAWTTSNYSIYFWNSTIVVVTAVVLIMAIGSMGSPLSRAICLSWEPQRAFHHTDGYDRTTTVAHTLALPDTMLD